MKIQDFDSTQRVHRVLKEIKISYPASWPDFMDNMPSSRSEVIKKIARISVDGYATIQSPGRVDIVPPAFSRTSLFWAKQNLDDIIVGQVAQDVANAIGSRLNDLYLSLNLVNSIPQTYFRGMSPWENVYEIPPMHYVSVRENGKWELNQTFELEDESKNSENLFKDLREAFVTHVRKNVESASLSVDVSGGVDSACNAYILRALHAKYTATHMESDDNQNSDTQWAKKIANDLGEDLHVFPSMGRSGSSFKLGPYLGRTPSTPIYWADTEAYVKNVAMLGGDKHRHYVGIGGDELFSSLPATPWSMARENMWTSPSLAYRYSRVTRKSFYASFRDIYSRESYEEQATRSMRDLIEGRGGVHRSTAWSGILSLPNFLTQKAVHLLEELSHSSEFTPTPYSCDRSVHQACESIANQVRILQQANYMFFHDGLELDSPYLNYDIACLALSLPARYRQAPHLNKSGLYYALKGIVPREIFERPVKGEYSASLYTAYDVGKREALRKIENGILVQKGLIAIDKLRMEMSMPSPTVDSINSIERIVSVERWLSHVHE